MHNNNFLESCYFQLAGNFPVHLATPGGRYANSGRVPGRDGSRGHNNAGISGC